jgi:hypothetical protein
MASLLCNMGVDQSPQVHYIVQYNHVRFMVLTVMNVKYIIFWNVTTYYLVDGSNIPQECARLYERSSMFV